MAGPRRIHWGRIVLAAFLSELAVFVVFFLLLFAATAAGVPELARPMSTLDNIDAVVSSFVAVFLFTLWVGRRLESAFVLHGALIGAVAAVLFGIMWRATTGSLVQPAPYLFAHVLKILGGIAGGVVAKNRQRPTRAAV